jgi:hypothetical protein
MFAAIQFKCYYFLLTLQKEKLPYKFFYNFENIYQTKVQKSTEKKDESFFLSSLNLNYADYL